LIAPRFFEAQTMTPNPNAAALADEIERWGRPHLERQYRNLHRVAIKSERALSHAVNPSADDDSAASDTAMFIATLDELRAALRSYAAPPPAEGDVREALLHAKADLEAAKIYVGNREGTPYGIIHTLEKINAVLRAPPSSGGGMRASSSIDLQQQRGRHADIIEEAINTYDEWMLDDDYESMTILRKIMDRMRERFALSASPSPIQPEGKK
jgi:hypothetical protein